MALSRVNRRRAVFLAKDAMLVENVPYNVDPDRIWTHDSGGACPGHAPPGGVPARGGHEPVGRRPRPAALLCHLAGVPSRSVAGSLDLAELAALLARADLLVANNTGPVVPCRVLSHDLVCRWCYKSVCPEGQYR